MLDWEKFKNLSGSDADNFEKLCRSIVRRRFGRYGPLMERKNQPGVEYYILLNQTCSELGTLNDKVGWQCKWFKTKANGQLTASSRSKILESLDKTDEHVPDIKRWILWTPFTLAKADQDWFYELKSKYSYQLDLWNADDIECFLDGAALELKETYFGDLALTPDALEKQHNISVAPIKERWIKEVHQQVNVERKIRKFLGEPYAWREFQSSGKSLSRLGKQIEKEASISDYVEWSDELKIFAQFCSEISNYTDLFKKPIISDDMELISGMLEQLKHLPDAQIHIALRQIRKNNYSLAIELTNALALIKDIRNLLQEITKCLSTNLVAILADAGGGKTQMAAEITAKQVDRPAGLLLHGRQLHKGDNLDDLARDIAFYGKPLATFSILLAALDAVAYRNNCRLPIIIDGLNEAEDPREWKPLLEMAQEMLQNYPNILLICTLRTGERERPNYGLLRKNSNETRETFTQMALPKECTRLDCDGFNVLTRRAIKSYFQHYKIHADFTQIPEGFFNHPLNLRIFCEVTNRKAEQEVTVTSFPASITTLFHSQIEYTAKRISELTNLQHSYSAEEVLKAVYLLGIQLWESSKRYVLEEPFLNSINQNTTDWNSKIVNLLAQEGIIFRDPGNTPFSFIITPVYDRLGGYIIASALLQHNKNDHEANWVKDQSFLDMLFGANDLNHQLSQDILHALVALMPQRLSKQFWKAVPKNYRDQVIELSTVIDAENFCDETKEAYRKQVLSNRLSAPTFFRLKRLRASVNHPLNADFFTSLLESLTISDRDLSWSEFLRAHRDDVLREVQWLEHRWKEDVSSRSEGDRLRALWISWLLTSTCADIRDYATRSLYWYGQGAPRRLFEMTIKSLEINDPYISERMLAVSYGIAMSYVCKGNPSQDIIWIAKQLHKKIFSKSATNPTTHLFARDYASKIIELASITFQDIISEEQLVEATHPFPLMPRMSWGMELDETRRHGIDTPFRMDFENYTIGRLVPGRRNYDYDNPAYQDIRAKVLWRVENLGWDKEKYAEVESRIDSDLNHHYHRQNNSRTERYGKKYSWIAYYEMAGQLLDEEKLEPWSERFDIDIDPNFPTPIEEKFNDTTIFLENIDDTIQWICNSNQPELDTICSIDVFDGLSGPWILLSGSISEESKRLNRSFYADVQGFLLENVSLEKLKSFYNSVEQSGISRPEIEQTGYIYSGEIYSGKRNKLQTEVEFEIIVGKEIEKIEQPIINIESKKDGSLTITTHGQQLVDVEVPKIEYVSAFPTVGEFSWSSESSSFPGCHVKVLNPNLIKKLNLTFDPTSLDFLDSQGNLAARNLSYKGSTYGNNRNFFYIRKDLITKYMAEEGLKLVWCIKGERRLARFDRYDSSTDGPISHMDFSFYKLLRD